MTILTSIESNYPLHAYTNSIISFIEPSSVKASIDIDGLTFYITPLSGTYYFNFLEIVKVRMNSNLFADKIIPADGFVNDYYAYKKFTITIRTYNSSNTAISSYSFNVDFLKSTLQIEEDPKERIILHDDFDGMCYFDIYEGLPFDITLFKNVYPFTLEIISPFYKIVKGKTVLDHNFFNLTDESPTDKVSRFYFIDKEGEIMQQQDPENKLMLTLGKQSSLDIVHGDSVIAKALINYKKACSGIYLKWFNIYGGWDYFLFSDKYQVNPNVKSLGEVNSGFNNYYTKSGNETIQALNGFTSELGKSAEVSFDIDESFLDEIQFKKVSKIIYSPKVIMWTGSKWIDVQITSKTKFNNKKQFGSVQFSLTLPERILQTI